MSKKHSHSLQVGPMPIDYDRHVCAFVNLHKILLLPATTYTAVRSLATTDAFFI
jgi:hypothetical protein